MEFHRTCKLCGDPFVTTSSRKQYCGKTIERVCKICGKVFETTCNAASPEFCSHACASQGAKFKTYYCVNCGKPFNPESSRQKYCKKPLHKTCPICGEDFTYPCSGTVPCTCGKKECKDKYSVQQSQLSQMKETRTCEWCGKEFHPINNTQHYCEGPHYQTCVVCGNQFEIDVTKYNDMPKTCSKECNLAFRFQNGNPFQNPVAREKARNTMLIKYGADHPMRSPEILERFWDGYKARTGYDHPSHNPEVRSQWFKNGVKNSQFEVRVSKLFDQYQVNYVRHYMLNSDVASHEFDFYLPDYKILVDCDGKFFHSYLEDPDGRHVEDYYDEDRLALIPKDHIFHVIVEGEEEKDIRYLVNMMKSMDSKTFDYEGELFQWCRSIEFPYPQYTEIRMKKDYAKLCKYDYPVYRPNARLGDSIIQQFHRSIYDARVGNYVSPKEAWYDDELLKKVILNRLIYKNDVDPFKILKGFNISKICPRVSVFNPVLAKHIVQVYLNEFSEVFDPFSGFSGRMIGTSSCGKIYIGQDLNETAVKESNQIIEFLQLQNCSVSNKDILQSSGTYECLMTCPPYGSKEHYSTESVIKSCDEWIDEIMQRFVCKRYAFVVDETENYKDYIKEDIKSISHFSKTVEHLIVIDK